MLDGSSGIASIWDYTHFQYIGFVVAGGGLNSYQNTQCIQRKKFCKKKDKFYA